MYLTNESLPSTPPQVKRSLKLKNTHNGVEASSLEIIVVNDMSKVNIDLLDKIIDVFGPLPR